jgi:hypothetical protein
MRLASLPGDAQELRPQTNSFIEAKIYAIKRAGFDGLA